MMEPEEVHDRIIELETELASASERISRLEKNIPLGVRYVFNREDKECEKIMKKLAQSKVGEVIPMTAREMHIISNPNQFTVIG